MTFPFQGGQCTGQEYYVTGTIVLVRIADGSRIAYQCEIMGVNGQQAKLSGPIIHIFPSSPIGVPSQGGTYYIGVFYGQGSFAACNPTVPVPKDDYIYESFSPTVTPAGSFTDNCGNTPQPPQQNPRNPPPGQPPGTCPVVAPANSEFDVHTGAVTEIIDLVTYQSLGEARGVSLRYSSLAADPRPILHFGYSQVYNPYQIVIAKVSIQRGSFTHQFPGYSTAQYGLSGGENFWSVPAASSSGYFDGILDVALQADLRTQPSGQYQYTVQRSVQYIDSSAPTFAPLGTAETATFIHVNRVSSPFGAGWSLVGWQEIIENPDGSVLLLDGDGTQLLFGAPATSGGFYSPPTGDFSRLEKLSTGTYRRTLTDQTVYNFNAQRRLISIQDRNGNITQYTYNIAGQLTQITDPVNLKTTFTYVGGLVTQITDPASRITKLEYNATSDLIKLTHPDNAVWQWEYQEHRMSASIDPRNSRASTRYDAYGRANEATRRDGAIVKIEPVAVKGLSSASQTNTFINPPAAYRWSNAQANSSTATYTDGNGHKLYAQVDARGSAVAMSDEIGSMGSYQYNSQNLVQVQINGRRHATNYAYDSKGNVTQITDTLSGTLAKRYTYDPTFNQLATVTDELGRQTLYDIDPANGNVRSISQVVGAVGGMDDQTTRYVYTTKGLISTVTDALNRITSYTYNAQGRLNKVILAQDTTDQSILNYTYDSAGNVATATDARNKVTKFFYDNFNRLIRVEEADPDGTGPLTGPITRYTYDPNGNLTQVQDARGNTTTYEYDTLNRLTRVTQPDPDGTGPLTGPTTTYQYDAVGNLRFVTDPLSHVTEYQYDARNRLSKIVDPRQGQIQFQYDEDNNLIVITDPLNYGTAFFYDARSRVTGEFQIDSLRPYRSYIYNQVNNLIRKIDRNNRITQFEYDDLNRLAKETWVGTTQQINYSYDMVGNLRSITDQYSALTYSYDNQNRTISIDNTGTPNLPAVVLSQTYDANSNRIKIIDTINAIHQGIESHSYDALNRLIQVSQTGTGVVKKRVNVTYNPIHQIETLKRYADLTGTLLAATSTYTYDPLSRLTQLAHTQVATATSINTYTYGYDAASRIIQMSSVDGANSYSYDNTDQLTGATYGGQNNETYDYDLNGNRTNIGYQTARNNRLQTDGTYNYTYDDEGNLTKRTTIATNETAEYTWDYRNRLTQVIVKNAAQSIIKQVNFVYDALNRRIEKKVDPDGSGPQAVTIERFVYDRDHIKLVFNGSNTLIRRYLHGPTIDQILADENTVPKQISWPLSDHQGTVRDLVNNSSVVQNHIRYDSFGQIVSQTAPALNPRFAYTGREWDSEIGLYFYRARYYDATVGRFIGEDPIGFGAEDVNLYRYVRNSPIQGTDPMGLLVVTPPPVVTPWYVPLLRRIPLTAPLVIPGGLLNPRPTNPYEFPHQLPKKKKPNSCSEPGLPIPNIDDPKRCVLRAEIPPRPNSPDIKKCCYKCKDYGALVCFDISPGYSCPEYLSWWYPDKIPGALPMKS